MNNQQPHPMHAVGTIQPFDHIGQIRRSDDLDTALDGQGISTCDDAFKALLDRRRHLDADAKGLAEDAGDGGSDERDAIVSKARQDGIPQLARRRGRVRGRAQRERQTGAEPDEAATARLQLGAQQLVRQRRLAAAHARRDEVERAQPARPALHRGEEVERVARERVVCDGGGCTAAVARPLAVPEAAPVARHAPHAVRLAQPHQQVLVHPVRHRPAVDEDQRHLVFAWKRAEVSRCRDGEPCCSADGLAAECWRGVVIDVVETCAVRGGLEIGHFTLQGESRACLIVGRAWQRCWSPGYGMMNCIV